MVDVQGITIERLKDWGADCIRDHATPALLLAIGHDDHAGEIHVYIPDAPFMEDNVRQWLKIALKNL